MIEKRNKTKKIAILVTPIIIIFIVMSFLMIIIIQNDSTDEETDYECKITEDSELTWKYTKFDPILIQNLSDIYNIELISLNDLGVNIESTIEYKLEYIEEAKNKWNLEFSYKFDDLSGENTQKLKIYKDPKDVPNSWIYNIEDLSLRILPSETQDYLDDIKDNFLSTENVDIERDSDLNLRICHHNNKTFVFTEFQYNDKGIIEKFTLIFIDSIALEYILDDYSLNAEIDENFNLLKIITAVLIFSTILIMIPIYGYVVSMNNRRNKHKICQKSSELNYLSNSEINKNYIINHQTKEAIESNHAKPKKIRYHFCELCGTKIDENAIYCHYCGNKLYYSK